MIVLRVLAVAAFAMMLVRPAAATDDAYIDGPAVLGRGLQEQYAVVLPTPTPYAVTFVLIADYPDSCRLTSDKTVLGTQTLSVTVPAGQRRRTFWVQTLAGAPQLACTVTGAQSKTVAIHTPEIGLVDLQTRFRAGGGTDGFSVTLGVRAATGAPFRKQALAPDANGERTLAITIANSNAGAGGLLDSTLQPPATPTRIVYVSSPFHAPNDERHPVAFQPIQTAITSDQSTTVSACASGFDCGQRPVVVRQSVVRLGTYAPPAVGIDLQDRFTLRLEPAPQSAVGVTLSVPPGAPCLLAKDPSSSGGATLGFTIGAGRSGYPFVVQGIGPPGSCDITVQTTSPVYPPTTLLPIPIECAAVRLEQVPGHLYQSSDNENFRIRIGVANDESTDLRERQSVRHDLTAGVTVKACAGPATVLAIPGADVYGCKPATISAESSATNDGALALDPGTPGAGWVVAEGADGSCTVQTDAATRYVDVRANEITLTSGSPDAVGVDLQDTFTLQLTPTPQASFTVDLAVSATAQCVLAADELTSSPDTLSLPIPVKKGQARYTFVVRGVSPAAGPDPCVITATTSQQDWPPSTEFSAIPIVTPALRITGLPSSLYVNADPEPFQVGIGVPTDNGRTLLFEQTVRPGVGPSNKGLFVEACVDDTTKATIQGLPSTSTNCAGAYIAPSDSDTAEGLKLDPGYPATVNVWAQADFAETTDMGQKQVVIRATDIRLPDSSPSAVGVDLEDTFTLKLEPAVSSGDAVVRVSVPDGAPCALAPDETTPGTTSVDLTITQGHSTKTFVVQGLALSETGCAIKAETTKAGYPSPVYFEPVPIRCTALRLAEGPANIALGQAADPFRIEIGPPNSKSSNLLYQQVLRPGRTQGVEACSDAPNAAAVIGAASPNPGCAAATIAATASSTLDDDLKLSPVAPATDVCIRANGTACTVGAGTKCVDVGPFGIDIDPTKAEERVGEQLWVTILIKATTQVAAATPVTVKSLTATHCLVSTDQTTPADDTATVTIPSGSARTHVVVHAIARGDCTIEAQTTTPVAVDTETIAVEPTAVALRDVETLVPVLAAQRYFAVALGVADSAHADVQYLQEARVDTTVRVHSTNPAVGLLRWQNGTPAGVVDVVVNQGDSRTANNQLAFIPVAKGQTDVCVEEIWPVGIVTDKGCQTVTVDPVDITINRTVDAIGAGLESNGFTLKAVPSDGLPSGGLPVRVASTNTSACVVGLNGTVAGTASFDYNMTGPTTFWVQSASRTAPATCTITVTPLALTTEYEGDSESVGIVQSYVGMVSAPTSVTVGQTLGFNVRVGLPMADLSDIAQTQEVSAKTGAWPIAVGLTAVPAGQEKAQLQTTTPSQQGQQVNLSIAPGLHDVTGSGLAITGVAQGNTTITASGTSLGATTAASQPVTVAAGGGGGC